MPPSDEKNIKKLLIKISAGICVTLILLAVVACIILKRGMSFSDLTIGKLNISHSTLVWNKKLELEIDAVTFIKKGSSKQTKPDIRIVKKSIDVAQTFTRFFSKLNINSFEIGEKSLTVNLHQEDDSLYTLGLITEDISFHSRLEFESDGLLINNIEVASKKYNSKATGMVRLDTKAEKATGTISALINESFPVSIDIIADREQISFEGKEAGQILEITSLVDLFGLSHNVQRWITDYLAGSRYHLKSFKGQFPWDNPGVILDTLEAEVRVDDTEYTFAPGLEPIKAKYTDVYFKKGVLAIKPHESIFYGQDAGESWLDINFKDPSEIILTAYIKTSAVANDDILNLLKYYRITLPFKQIGGITDTDLRLSITLNKLKVGAEGTFTINEGVVLFGSTVFTVKDARISLDNSDITIDNIIVGYEDLLVARVTGIVQARDGIGDLDIVLEEVNLVAKGTLLRLDTSETAPKANYHFDRKGHVFEAGPSAWQLDSERLDVGPFRAPVRWDELALDLPPIRMEMLPGIQIEVSGFISIKKKKAAIRGKFLKYKRNDMALLRSPVSIYIDYDKEWIYRTEETAYFSLNSIPLTLYPSEYRLDDNFFTIINSRISYGTFFETAVSGKFNHKHTEGIFTLQDIDVTDKDLATKNLMSDEMLVNISTVDGRYVISSPELHFKISSNEDNNWLLEFGDLSTLYSRSKLLQKYGISEGTLAITSKNGKKPFNFSANIPSPYSLLIDDDGPVERLDITGKLTDKGVKATINKDLHTDFAGKKLAINSNNVAFNVPALIQISKALAQSDGEGQDEKSKFLFSLNAEDSFLYLGPNSKILADHIKLEYRNGIVKMKLNHGTGKIVLKTEDGHFLADGSNLNDTFIGALIQNSSFRDGQMLFSAMGSFDKFSALFEIKNTTLTDLVALNNAMALINTGSSLMTFSLPDYNMNGLSLDSAVIGLKFKDMRATFESMNFVSPGFQAAGIGWIDFSQKLIDLDVSVVTERKNTIRNVPVAGYMLQGDKEEASLTIKIKGGYDDPDVTHSLKKEIASKPFKVLFRTLGLPVHALKELSKESESQ